MEAYDRMLSHCKTPNLIFSSIDMDNLDRELLVQPSEPYSQRGVFKPASA